MRAFNKDYDSAKQCYDGIELHDVEEGNALYEETVKEGIPLLTEHLSDRFAPLAGAILEGVMRDYGSEAAYQDAVWGRTLSHDEVQAACDAYADANGLQGKVKFVWNEATLVTMCSGGTVHLVTRPNYYRELRLASLLDHEVGTHFVRSFNHKKALGGGGKGPAWKARRGWLLATEEGLATLNTHRRYADKRFWIPALHYHAALLASRLPFSQLWAKLSAYLGDDAERLWTTCLRVKRGMQDTGRPGGYYKDLSNFDGAARLLQQRRTIDWPLLHCVRVSIEDFGAATPAAKRALAGGAVLLPGFVAAEEAYRQGIEEMAEANGVAADAAT